MNQAIPNPLPPLAALALVALLGLAGCVSPPAPAEPAALPAVYTPAIWADLPGFARDDLAEAWPALLAGCEVLATRPATQPVWRPPCAAAASVDPARPGAVRDFVVGHFSPWRVSFPDGRVQGLVTGYYEPRLPGSREPSTRHRVPLYAPPDDLLTVELADLYPALKDQRVRARVEGRRVLPYWSRTEIESGRAPLAGKALAYVADPLDAFFLQVQGSGRIELADGGVLRLGYADQNGHPYKAIGRVLVERGELTPETATMPGIRAWARANPDKVPALLAANPSYVFFRELPRPAAGTPAARIDGPPGSLGVPLLARRTIAVDPRAIPLGAPVWLATPSPVAAEPIERLVLAQDTGGAIRGAVRADFFWGSDAAAAEGAGRMREQGRLWLLWPKGETPPR